MRGITAVGRHSNAAVPTYLTIELKSGPIEKCLLQGPMFKCHKELSSNTISIGFPIHRASGNKITTMRDN